MQTTSLLTPALGTAATRRAPAPSASQPLPSARPLAAMLLAAIVSALVVAADALVDTYADGHLLLAWSVLWATGFAAMALFAGSARALARRMLTRATAWQARRAEVQADEALWALAQRDPRIMAELQGAMERAREAQCATELAHGRAWVEHHPLGTLNAAYAGPRRLFRTSPLTGLPTHMQFFPG
jgi:hypothetical protein